jgi:thiamine pyrophosphate-dependent acetolactate synthase large subunit-like protein
MLPEARTLVVDGGHFMAAPLQYLTVDDPRRFVFPVTFGSVGLGLGAAIGAALAHRDGTTIVAIGDGGWMMSLAEFSTAVRERLDLIVIAFNDSAYGQEWQNLSARGLDPELSLHNWPDLAETARGLGGEAVTLSAREDFANLPEIIAARTRPMVLNVRTHPSVKFGVGD